MSNVIKNYRQRDIITVIDNCIEYGMNAKEKLPEYGKEITIINDILNKLYDIDNIFDYENEYDSVFNTLKTIEKDKIFCYVVARMIINHVQGINDYWQLKILGVR